MIRTLAGSHTQSPSLSSSSSTSAIKHDTTTESTGAKLPSPESYTIAIDQQAQTSAFTLSYHDDNRTVFGCKHYQRNARIRNSNCCQRFFTCRFCHDEYYNNLNQSNTSKLTSSDGT